MIHRRKLLATVPVAIPLAAFSMSADSILRAQENATSGSDSSAGPVLASPPVVQHRTNSGFTVVFKTGTLATAHVDWGLTPENLDNRSYASHHGLKSASDIALSIRIEHGSEHADAPIFYRVTATPLRVEGRNVIYGKESTGSIHQLKAASPDKDSVHIVVINDTHENAATIAKIANRIEALDPDAVIWNGDTCNDFHPEKDVAAILLKPGQQGNSDKGGWASSRPLIFVPGNHDVRGRLAYQVQSCLPGWPSGTGNSGVNVPYCSLLRFGPLALVSLDTGEDKPDAHPSFQGTAAYEPYRAEQGKWLAEAVKKPEFTEAKYKIAVCHIPLRGLEGHNDGTTLEGYAYFSGFGSKHWMQTLVQSKVKTVISGHMHQHRVDAATESLPTQIVLGGPQLERATICRIIGNSQELIVQVENLNGDILTKHQVAV